MDFSKQFNFKAGQTSKMELRNPGTDEIIIGDDKKPVWIEVYGQDSDAFRNATRDYGNKKLQRGAKKQTMEEIEQTACKILGKSTVGWSNNFSLGGVKPEFSTDNAEQLYIDYPWIKEQVDAHVNDRANFLPTA